MKDGFTRLALVLDRSGSMASIEETSYTLGERKASLFEDDNDEGAESGRAGF
jgi:hypothetical protein